MRNRQQSSEGVMGKQENRLMYNYISTKTHPQNLPVIMPARPIPPSSPITHSEFCKLSIVNGRGEWV